MIDHSELLEQYKAVVEERDRLTVENERTLSMTVGYMYAYACNCMDEGIDIRKLEAPLILEKALAACEVVMRGEQT